MAAGYVIVEAKITDMDRFKAYMAAAPATIQAAGGEYLVRGGKLEALEGDWTPVRLTLLRFPGYEAAKAWYDGQAYGAARAKRADCTEYFNMVLVEGA